jgi:hypothetical protein
MYEEPAIDPRVTAYAAEHGLDEGALDWHVEAVHGWERHDTGYEEAVVQSAACLTRGGCENLSGRE